MFEAAVIGKPCPVLGERVHAFVVTRQPGATEAELTAFCKERLTDYQMPESFTLTDSPLPRIANGKMRKKNLQIPSAD